jgi:hypothetical protein
VRLSRIRLLPRVSNGESLVGPGVDDARLWEVVGRELYHPGPSASALLAAAIEYPLPAFDDFEPEHPQGTTVGRHCVVVEIAANDAIPGRRCARPAIPTLARRSRGDTSSSLEDVHKFPIELPFLR